MNFVLVELLGEHRMVQVPQLPHFRLVTRRTNLDFRHFHSSELSVLRILSINRISMESSAGEKSAITFFTSAR